MSYGLKSLLAFAALVALGLTSLTSCGAKETELPFETIAQGDKFGTAQEYSEVDPDLLIITAIEEVNAPDMNIEFGSDLAEQLRAVPYNNIIVIIVFRGQLGGTNPSVSFVQRT